MSCRVSILTTFQSNIAKLSTPGLGSDYFTQITPHNSVILRHRDRFVGCRSSYQMLSIIGCPTLVTHIVTQSDQQYW